MAYDYRPGTAKKNGNGTVRPLLIGLMLGLVLGIAIAAGVAIYIARIPSPFTHESSAETAKPTIPPRSNNDAKSAPATKSGSTGTSEKKPYTFYDILEGNKTPKPDQPGATAKPETTTARADDKTLFYLQAGSYQTEADADNQKARIALLGLEARVKSATLADKGTVYRVRLGPYKSQEEAAEIKTTLNENGVEVGLIKIVKSSPQASVN